MSNRLIRDFEDFVKLGAISVAAIGVGGFMTSCDDQQPVVVTDERHVVVDMPPGVDWDVQFDEAPLPVVIARCNDMGGEFDASTFICHHIDF